MHNAPLQNALKQTTLNDNAKTPTNAASQMTCATLMAHSVFVDSLASTCACLEIAPQSVGLMAIWIRSPYLWSAIMKMHLLVKLVVQRMSNLLRVDVMFLAGVYPVLDAVSSDFKADYCKAI